MFKFVLLACLLIVAVNASGVVVSPAVVPAVNYGYGQNFRGRYLRDRVVSDYAYNDGEYYNGYYGYPGYYGYNGLGYAGHGGYLGGYLGYPYGYYA